MLTYRILLLVYFFPIRIMSGVTSTNIFIFYLILLMLFSLEKFLFELHTRILCECSVVILTCSLRYHYRPRVEGSACSLLGASLTVEVLGLTQLASLVSYIFKAKFKIELRCACHLHTHRIFFESIFIIFFCPK